MAGTRFQAERRNSAREALATTSKRQVDLPKWVTVTIANSSNHIPRSLVDSAAEGQTPGFALRQSLLPQQLIKPGVDRVEREQSEEDRGDRTHDCNAHGRHINARRNRLRYLGRDVEGRDANPWRRYSVLERDMTLSDAGGISHAGDRRPSQDKRRDQEP